MAVDMFLKIDGIKGEATDAKHKDEIDVLSWSWGVVQTGTARTGAGGGAGKASFNDLSITKNLDSASPLLAKFCSTGEHVKEMTLTLRKAGKDQHEYTTMKLNDCIVSSVSISGGGDTPMENASFNFMKIKIEYKPQKPDGTLGGVVPFAYDIKANKAT